MALGYQMPFIHISLILLQLVVSLRRLPLCYSFLSPKPFLSPSPSQGQQVTQNLLNYAHYNSCQLQLSFLYAGLHPPASEPEKMRRLYSLGISVEFCWCVLYLGRGCVVLSCHLCVIACLSSFLMLALWLVTRLE